MCSLDLEKCLQNSKNAFTDFSPFKMAFLQRKYSINAAYFGLWDFLPPCLNHCVRHFQRQCLRKHRQPMITWRLRTCMYVFYCKKGLVRSPSPGQGGGAPGRGPGWEAHYLLSYHHLFYHHLSYHHLSYHHLSYHHLSYQSFVLPIICPTVIVCPTVLKINHLSYC